MNLNQHNIEDLKNEVLPFPDFSPDSSNGKSDVKKEQVELMDSFLSLKSQKWSTTQLFYLFTMYNTYGSQWAIIQSVLPDKNKVQIRNKFYGTLRKLIRSCLQHFQVPIRSLSKISNQLKPSTLQKIYHSQKEFGFVNGKVSSVLSQMGFQIDAELLQSQFRQNSEIYSKIIDLILPPNNKHKQKSVKLCHQTSETAGSPLVSPVENNFCFLLGSVRIQQDQYYDSNHLLQAGSPIQSMEYKNDVTHPQQSEQPLLVFYFF